MTGLPSVTPHISASCVAFALASSNAFWRASASPLILSLISKLVLSIFTFPSALISSMMLFH